jgi:hypothetical protein
MNARNLRKLALITGASGGIGEAFAHELAADGYALVLVARREAELQRVKGVIAGKYAVPVTVIALDLTAPGACDHLGGELAQKGLEPDLVVNNAGFGLVGKAQDLAMAEQTECVDLNVRALTDLSLRFLPAMKTKSESGIINVASVAGFAPGPNMAVYFATKNYVLAFSEALSHELKDAGIKVMCLCPGPVITGFQERAGMTSIRAIPGSVISPSRIARDAWSGFKSGRRVYVPGALNWLAAHLSRLTPRWLGLPVTAFILARSARNRG